MRNFFLLVLMTAALYKCKQDSKEPLTPIKSIIGKWRLTEKQIIVNGQQVWLEASNQSPYSFIISPDGIILNNDGLPECCVPNTLVVNGVTIEIPHSSELPANPDCARVNCAPCDYWDMETSGDEMIIDYCGRERAKFVKD